MQVYWWAMAFFFIKKFIQVSSMMDKINTRTLVGVGAGVLIGSLILKSRSPLVLMAMGLGGGILSRHAFKTKEEKLKEANEEVIKQLQGVKQDIESSLDTGDAEQKESFSGNENIRFNPTVGYPTPKGDVVETSGSNYMDVSF